MNILNSMQQEYTLSNPQLYIDYLSEEHNISANTIVMVSDNGYGYEWEIHYVDNTGHREITSFHPIKLIEWLGKSYNKEYSNV